MVGLSVVVPSVRRWSDGEAQGAFRAAWGEHRCQSRVVRIPGVTTAKLARKGFTRTSRQAKSCCKAVFECIGETFPELGRTKGLGSRGSGGRETHHPFEGGLVFGVGRPAAKPRTRKVTNRILGYTCHSRNVFLSGVT